MGAERLFRFEVRLADEVRGRSERLAPRLERRCRWRLRRAVEEQRVESAGWIALGALALRRLEP